MEMHVPMTVLHTAMTQLVFSVFNAKHLENHIWFKVFNRIVKLTKNIWCLSDSDMLLIQSLKTFCPETIQIFYNSHLIDDVGRCIFDIFMIVVVVDDMKRIKYLISPNCMKGAKWSCNKIFSASIANEYVSISPKATQEYERSHTIPHN
jgi:hypothetical protein